jgi:hypothetical protein
MRAATPASTVLGGAGPGEGVSTSRAAAQAAQRRSNLLAAEKLAKAAAARAATAAAEEAEQRRRHEAQAQASAANATRAAAEAAAAAQGQRAVWGGGALLDDAMAVFQASSTSVHAAQLLAILQNAHDNASRRSLNVHAAGFPNAHGALAVLLACGFAWDERAARLVLPAAHNKALLVEAIGRL